MSLAAITLDQVVELVRDARHGTAPSAIEALSGGGSNATYRFDFGDGCDRSTIPGAVESTNGTFAFGLDFVKASIRSGSDSFTLRITTIHLLEARHASS